MKKYIGVDLGASSGRISIGTYKNKKITISEIHRFENRPVFLNGTLYWDFLRLFSEVKIGITKCLKEYPGNIRSIGIDAWGVDFGLINKRGKLLANPVSYRDRRTDNILDDISIILSNNEIFMNTGEVIMKINTIFQLYYLVKIKSLLLENAANLLMMPDLFNYFLSGETYSEYSEAVTTQIYDQRKNCWSKKIMEKLNIPFHIFPEIIFPGEVIGSTTKYIDDEVGTDKLNIVSTCSHDASSAVAGLPLDYRYSKKKWAFLLIGTWSALGIELKNRPVITPQAFNLGFSNEGSTLGRFSFQKIMCGLWLIQECRNYWMRIENREITWNEISKCAHKADCFQNYIDVDDPIFTNKAINMLDNLSAYYQKTHQRIIMDKNSVSRSIYEGLTLKFKNAILDIEKITGEKIEILFITGGGSKNKLLCQWISDALHLLVITGIPETTTIGNILLQLKADKEINKIDEGRQIVANSFKLQYFTPAEEIDWDKAFDTYCNITCQN
jgi:rhamnulokinase/L-fuculokinase